MLARAFLCLGLAAAAAGYGTSASAQALEPAKIGFYPGTMLSTIVLVAEAKGFYRAAGVDPTLISTASGPIANSNIASGAIDFALQPPSNVGIARDQGLDQVYVAGNLYMPWVVIARSDIKLANKGKYPDVMKDLKNMSWGPYARGSDSELFLRVMGRDAGLDVDKDVTWVGVGGPPTGLPALKTGKIDVYLALDPAPLVATSQGYGQIVVDLRKGEGPADFRGAIYQGMVTKRTLAQKNPKLIDKVVEAHKKTYCWINDKKNFEELLAFLKTKLPVGDLSEDQYRSMVVDGLPLLTVAFPPESLKVWDQMLLRAQAIKTTLEPEKLLWKSAPAKNPSCG